MLESESDTLRFVSSWHSDAQTECDEAPDCVAIVQEPLTTDLLSYSKLYRLSRS